MRVTFKFLLLLLLACVNTQAQEAVRHSLASEEAADARKRSRTGGAYNIDLDPVRLRFSTSLSGEYNDNVNLSDANPREDYIVRPRVGVRAFWQVSDRNALDFALDLGYEHYMNGVRESRVIVTGDEGSGLFFDIYIGDFVINLHDKFSLSQDTSSDPTASGVADIFRLENTVGSTVTWDLNRLVLTLNCDHYNYAPLDDQFKYLTHQSELATFQAAAQLNPALTAGLELGGGITAYSEPRLSDNRHFSIGPFARYQLSDSMDVRASVGYAVYWFDASTVITNESTQTGLYADVSISHRPTQRTAHTLRIGESLTTDINSSPISLFYIRYAATLNIIRHWSFGPRFDFETGSETRGVVQEDLTRYSAGLSVRRQITEKLSGSLSYYLLLKTSSLANADYTQNRLVLDLTYQF